MAEIPEQTQPANAEYYQQLLNVVEAHMSQLTQIPLETRFESLTELEKAKYKTVLSYAITTLQLCYLRSKKESLENHPNMRHLDRIKNYFNKLERNIDLAAK